MRSQVERTLQQEIMLGLRAYPVVAVPVPNGIWIPSRDKREESITARIVAQMKRNGMLLPGAPDLILMWRSGCAAVELKAPAGRPSTAQRDFAERCNLLLIHHAYVTSWEELRTLLHQWGLPKPWSGEVPAELMA